MGDSGPFKDYNLYPTFHKEPRPVREAGAEDEAGTSAGAQKGWETRKGGGAAPAEPSRGEPPKAEYGLMARRGKRPPRPQTLLQDLARKGGGGAGKPDYFGPKGSGKKVPTASGALLDPGMPLWKRKLSPQTKKWVWKRVTSESTAAPGPRVYTKRGHRLRIEAEGSEYRLVDSRGKVHRTGDRTTIEHHIGEQLRRGAYRAR